MNNIKRKLITWLAGFDAVGELALLRGAYRAMSDRFADLIHRVEARDAGVVPGRGLGLPSPAFLGVQSYGKGVTKEDALNYNAIKVPGMGLMLSRPEKSGPVKVTRTSDGRHLFDFDVRGLQFPPVATNENGVGYGGGEIKFGAGVN